MKFNCDALSDWLNGLEERRTTKWQEREGKWFPYFLWLPMKLAHGDCRWLETVERSPKLVPWYDCHGMTALLAGVLMGSDAAFVVWKYRAKDRDGSVPQPA